MSEETLVPPTPASSGAQNGSETATPVVVVEPYIDKHEVARRMDSTTRTVDNMMRRGLLPYYKLGYRVAFRWSEIQAHLARTCGVAARAKRNAETRISRINTNPKPQENQ